MKPSDMTAGALCRLELRAVGTDALADVQVGEEVVLSVAHGLGTVLRSRGRATAVRGADARTQRRLDDVLQRDLPRVTWVLKTESGGGEIRSVLIQNHEFPLGHSLPEELTLQIGDDLLDELGRRRGLRTLDQVERFLADECVLHPADSRPGSRLVVSAGRSRGESLNQAFRVHGPRFCMDVERRTVAGGPVGASALFVRRVVAARAGADREPAAMQLVEVRLVFKDASKGSVASEVRTELEAILQASGSYLGLWAEYNDLERRVIESEATEFGSLAYTRWSETRTGVRFECGHLDGSGLSRLRACRQDRVDLQATEEPSDAEDGPPHGRVFVGEPVAVDGNVVVVRPRENDATRPPPRGFLSVCVIGDRKRLQRRERARDLVAAARCPVPWLGLLIEGKPFPVTRRKRNEPLSAAARKAFRGNPTPAQEMAVDAALNTPDIAIIQGPPGTGKTRVIAALQARLAELDEGEQGPFGQTLLTSYQHDAVDNAAAASVAFGLPSFRVGGRSGVAGDNDSTDLWRRDLVSKLKGSIAHQGSTPVHVVRRDLRRVILAQQQAPSEDAAALSLLEQVQSQAGPYLDDATSEHVYRVLRGLRTSEAVAELPLDRQVALRAVSGLPTTAESARDDGPRRTRRALLALDQVDQTLLHEIERGVLVSMSEWDGTGEPPGLSVLEDVRASLLDRLRPSRVQDDRARRNERVEEVLHRVYGVVDELARNVAFDASVAVEDLIQDLEADPQAVRDEVARYASTLAATVQHAVGTGMQTVKDSVSEPGSEEWPRFRNVIVDEAARCNPLDLMIPLSIAERRIVLVGDHRQLPHVLEPAIERELSKSTSDATSDALGRSLFERLVKHVRALELQDGIKRYVRLDRQYRMPPVLGDFVSGAFYAPHGEQFVSGRSAEEFEHGLSGPLAGKVGAWIDVPRELGAEVGGESRSKSRPAEAQRIASEVHRHAEGRPDLSVGVITFYRDQVDELNAALGTYGIVERGSQGQWEPTATWKVTTGSGESRPRLRVGTVDAFQGMEFDLVFLSLVRCNSYPITTPQALRRKFGFLLLENRVCVAMSRQQRLLVVVGDSEMVRGEALAQEAGVSALRSFLEFCGGPHGVRI